jgi:hypothetical protein|tara:strand:- start:3672 stop:5096 length:1425 start_codon:yes stop_codon:yes gene_type:complete
MPKNMNRRQLFEWSTHGLGSIALLELLQRDGVFAQSEPAANTNHSPRVKRAIQISLVGGMSHVDSFDYKPELTKKQGKTLGSDEKPDIFFGKVGLLRGSDWEFKQRGQSGLWISEMFPHIAKMADELTLIRSMVSESANHTPALFASNSGFLANGFPALGSWLSYGLGSETETLPAFVVLPDERGGPNGGASNWTSGYLPGQNQGVVFTGGDQPVRDLFPSTAISPAADQDTRKFIEFLNRNHLDKIGQDEKLLARIRSYELAAQLQTSIPEVSRYADEPEAVRTLYGIDDKKTADMGRRCLLGRRLLERGVRFVQVYSGGPIAGNPRASWDAHESVKDNHSQEAERIDKPVAALLQDLKQRDMLKDTLVIFTTEFGRTPFAQSAANQVGPGRDHNRYGFSCWLAGGGLRAGTSYGQTDEIGWKAVENPVTWNDFHATILHMFGIEHEQLTFYHNGIQRRLTNVAGDVVTGILS